MATKLSYISRCETHRAAPAIHFHSGKFPIGVAKYLTWKQTLWIDRFTCTHHLWTMPVFIYGANKLMIDSYLLSIFIVVSHVLLGRWLTPHYIQTVDGANDVKCNEHGENRKCKQIVREKGTDNHKLDPQRYRYLNVNLAHELWRDISFGILQISKDNPPCWLYLLRLLWRWQLFNFLVFAGILYPLSRYIIVQ